MIRRSYIYPFVVCLLVCAGVNTSLASTAVVPRDEEMVVESRAIVTGRVMELSTGLDASKGVVFTYVRLRIDSVIKGQITESEIVLKELGGETSELGTMIFGMPKFDEGQDVLVYLNTWPDGSLRVHQGFLGKFNVTRNRVSGRLEVERQEEGVGVEVMSSTANVTTGRTDLEAYRARINNLMQANAESAARFEQKYYEGVPVHSLPPGFDQDRAFGKIRPTWALLNPTRPLRWFEADSNGQVVFYVNPAGAPDWDYQEDIRQALKAWSSAAGVKVKVMLGGETSGCGVQTADGKNTISFNNCDGYFAPSSGCTGMLAVGGIVRYSPSDTKTVSGMTFYRGIEANVSFNPYALCNYANRCWLQESMTHELGHALGLGHSSDTSATMNAFAHFDGRCASLGPDDTTGISLVYPGGSLGGSLAINTNADLGSVKVARDYSASLEASGGAGSYRWTVVGGSLPPGLQIGLSGFLYGTPGEPGSYAFSAQVTDSKNSTAQRSFSLQVLPPNPTPLIVGVEYRNKKVFGFGSHFDKGAVLLVDGAPIDAKFDESSVKTKKKAKLKSGVHAICVINEDGKRSSDFSFVVE